MFIYDEKNENIITTENAIKLAVERDDPDSYRVRIYYSGNHNNHDIRRHLTHEDAAKLHKDIYQAWMRNLDIDI